MTRDEVHAKYDDYETTNLSNAKTEVAAVNAKGGQQVAVLQVGTVYCIVVKESVETWVRMVESVKEVQ